MKWFKHYANAHTNKFLQTLLDQRNGAELYGRYFLLLELLCSEFKNDTTEFTLSNKQLRDALLIKSDAKLERFFNLLSALNESFGKSLFNFHKNTNLFWKIETSIILDLMDYEFKRPRRTRGVPTAKKENKKKNKKQEIEIRNSAELNTASKIDFQFYMDTWNNTLGQSLTPIRALTDKRKTMIRTLLKKYPEFSLDDYLKEIKASDFLCGSTEWKADFDWCFKHSNYLKVIEGRYKNNKPKGFDIDSLELK
jgi:hypothetical protein